MRPDPVIRWRLVGTFFPVQSMCPVDRMIPGKGNLSLKL